MSLTRKGFEISKADFYDKLYNKYLQKGKFLTYYFVFYITKKTEAYPTTYKDEYSFSSNFNNISGNESLHYILENNPDIRLDRENIIRYENYGTRILIHDPAGTGKNAYCTLKGPGTHNDFFTEITVPSANGPYQNNEIKISKNESFTVTC